MKTVQYVAGFNLCYSALRGTPHRWLNPVALAVHIVKLRMKDEC
jgi:hypothetical protein